MFKKGWVKVNIESIERIIYLWNFIEKMSKLERNSSSANQSSGLNFNDDSLLDADESNDFELRNENYNLKIKINKLEYEINKLSIDY